MPMSPAGSYVGFVSSDVQISTEGISHGNSHLMGDSPLGLGLLRIVFELCTFKSGSGIGRESWSWRSADP